MSSNLPEGPLDPLPPIPAKRYFTIGEVSELCGVKPHVLRYWEQEFTQLNPAKRRGNRRDYQHHEVMLVRRIRDLLYGRASPFPAPGINSKTKSSTPRKRPPNPPAYVGHSTQCGMSCKLCLPCSTPR